MADAKQDKTKEKKEPNSEGAGFKTVMGGFDKNEVNLYINKLKKQMKEQQQEFERRINNLQTNLEDANREAALAKNNPAAAAAEKNPLPIVKDNSEEYKKIIADMKAESDKKIMDLRKSVLDERRNVAKFDKEAAMAKMSEKKVREEYDKLKEKYLELKKKSVGTVVQQKAVTTHNADEVMEEAGSFAKELIAAAKSYADETVRAADKYKAEVEAELRERADKLEDIRKRLDEQIKKTDQEQADSAAKVKEISDKIGSVTALFDSFAAQFNSVNSQISGVTGKIDKISKQFSETTGQISTVAKQISETTSQIGTVSRQINETTSQIDSFSKTINETTSQITGFAKSINETTDKINEASKQMSATTEQISETSKAMNETSGLIAEASKKMNETSGQITEASKQMEGFTDSFSSAKSDIEGITKLVDGAKLGVVGAQTEVKAAQNAAKVTASAADLSPISRIAAELEDAAGSLKAKLILPKLDESRFSPARFDEIKKKLRIETTYEEGDTVHSELEEDDDEFTDSDIISTLESDGPSVDIPSDDDLMSDVPDVITAPVYDEPEPAKKPEHQKAAASQDVKPAKPDKADRPGLDSDFEDFFMTDPKDDDMSGEMPLINMEGVGVVEDFSLDAAPEDTGADFDIEPIDKTAKPEMGDELGAEIFDLAIDPDSKEDNTLADMMADAKAAETAANKDLTPAELNFDEDDTLPITAADDFGEFADLFAAGSSQTEIKTDHSHDKPAFKKSSNSDDPWSFGEMGGDDSDLSSDADFSDFIIK